MSESVCAEMQKMISYNQKHCYCFTWVNVSFRLFILGIDQLFGKEKPDGVPDDNEVNAMQQILEEVASYEGYDEFGCVLEEKEEV